MTGRSPLLSLWDTRLVHLAGLGVLVYFLGGAWDILWHLRLGRETFLSPPHLVLYAGLAAIFFSLALALRRAWRHRGRELPRWAIRLPGGVGVDPGLFIAGLGAVMSLSSAPIDEAWHRIFGLDLTIWSPPHVQLILGVAIAILGLMTSLARELNHLQPDRLRAALRPWQRDPRTWTLFGLAALLSMALSGLVIEWDLDIPAYSPVFYPIVFAAFTVGPLALGARAAGWRWSATAVALMASGLILLLQSVFVLLASGRFVLPVAILGGLVVDGLWQPTAYRDRPLRVALAGSLAGLAMVTSRMAYMSAFQAIYWPREAWTLGVPLSVVSGGLVALVGMRIGAALRPLPAEAPQPAHGSGLARRLAGLLVLLALLLPAPADAHGPTPLVAVDFAQEEAVVGQPVTVFLRIPEHPQIRSTDLHLIVSREQRYLEPAVRAYGQGFRATFVVDRPGQWGLSLRIQGDHHRWIAWTFAHVTPPGVPSPLPLEAAELRSVVDRTYLPGQVPVVWLRMGELSVWTYTLLLGAGVVYALRKVERDGRALIAEAPSLTP